MRPTTQGRVPLWPRAMSPSKYAMELQTWVSNHEMHHKLKYTELQQSQEVLYQALQSYNTPPFAIRITSGLNHWIHVNPIIINSFPVMAPLTAPVFGVHFLGGVIPSKIGLSAPS
jgi:hypothetical protein